MALMDIADIRDRSFMRLSGGQQQRALLARALCATRSLLLLDEPVAGLDPVVTRELYEVIAMLHRDRGLTVVMISHDVDAARPSWARRMRTASPPLACPLREVSRVIEMLSTMFSYQFMVRALIVGLLVSLCAALLGVSLVLKRYSMIGDGLSHVGFGALAVATALGMAPMAVTIPVVVAAAFLLLRLSSTGRLKGDAAIAMISTGALAVGVIVLSLSTGMTSDVNNYLFGSMLAMSGEDVTLSVVLAAAVLMLFVLFYRRIFAVTFDETFARATGGQAEACNMLLALLTAVTIVLGMRVMGTMLISSLIIFPALTAMRVCRSFKSVTLCAAAVSVVCFFVGLCASYLLSTAAGATVVVANILAFLIFAAVGRLRG